MKKDVDTKSTHALTTQLQNDILTIRNRIAGELTGGRWLWTSGQLLRDSTSNTNTNNNSTNSSSWIAWDTEAVNAAPAILCWKKGATNIQIRMPGLYRVSIAIFTSLPCALQLCLNGEPIITMQPDINKHNVVNNSTSSGLINNESHIIKRSRHSIGEVTCISIDEYVSLPTDGLLSVRYHSNATSQGFLSIKKL